MQLGDLIIFISKSLVPIPPKIFSSKEYFVQGYWIFWSRYIPEGEEDKAPRAAQETSMD
jgi:hypothetical protein